MTDAGTGATPHANPPDGWDGVIRLRVRYQECDPMGVAHHSAYAVWFEMARTELLRRTGVSYREIEARGVFFVVARLNVRYHRPARYDDELEIRVRRTPGSAVKLEHAYEVHCDGRRLATAETTLACVDAEGRLQRVPEM